MSLAPAAAVERAVAGTAARVQGACAPGFEPVLDAFVRNFQAHGELGAAVCIEVDGRPVVDLWGGHRDADRREPWTADTVCVVFSNTKPATALCAHMLAEAGELDLDRPVGHLWPAFARADKAAVTTRMLLDHTAGLPVVREPLPDGAAFDPERMVAALEAQPPLWEPGTRVAYHGLTYGWLVGEVVRRASGLTLGDFFRTRIAGPLGLDFWIGLPAPVEPRVAPIVPVPPAPRPRNDFERAVQEAPDSVPALYMRNSGGWRPSGFNSRAGHAAQVGAAGGITHARALARLYGVLARGGTGHGVRLLRAPSLERAVRVSAATHHDATLCVPTRYASGFMREMDNRARGLDSLLIGADAFGHSGAGGSVAFASPRHAMGFAYVMNRLGPGVLLNERAHGLIEAAHAALAQRAPTLSPTAADATQRPAMQPPGD